MRKLEMVYRFTKATGRARLLVADARDLPDLGVGKAIIAEAAPTAGEESKWNPRPVIKMEGGRGGEWVVPVKVEIELGVMEIGHEQ
ncbi:hypothetical protein BHE90_009333 [Fusarium euwallaceae]|uniref:Uncharacterized protein n=1 Tax=Fusarium euwallaceae TaxID=1147111 RepID=A0A430LKE7_9HYPO|nr:hypothetical protein BHE90_009333 [Fusarium euwallaceae]